MPSIFLMSLITAVRASSSIAFLIAPVVPYSSQLWTCQLWRYSVLVIVDWVAVIGERVLGLVCMFLSLLFFCCRGPFRTLRRILCSISVASIQIPSLPPSLAKHSTGDLFLFSSLPAQFHCLGCLESFSVWLMYRACSLPHHLAPPLLDFGFDYWLT